MRVPLLKIAVVTVGGAAGLVGAAALRAGLSRPSDQDGPSELPNGVRRDTWTNIPLPLRVVGTEIASLGAWLVSQVDDGTPPERDPESRADASESVLLRQFGVRAEPGMYTEHAGDPWMLATVWPLGQVLEAHLATARMSGDYQHVNDVMRELSTYRFGNAYAPNTMNAPLITRRFWDDNAWIGLAMLRAYDDTMHPDYLEAARSLIPFIQEGEHPDGGMYWLEGAGTRHTVSTAPVIELLLGLYRHDGTPALLEQAQRLDAWLNSTLRSTDGLYYDHLGLDGTPDKRIFSYNQGNAIGADLEFFRVTGKQEYLDRAIETAHAALEYFAAEDRLWKQPPAFNAIFFRNLIELNSIAPDSRYRSIVERYANRAWNEGRDAASGLFTEGGIGSYGSAGSLVDQAGMTQIFAMLERSRVDEPSRR